MGKQVFVGREKELQTLKTAFAETQKGLGKLVLVAGEPGSGKTALIREFINHIQTENKVLTAISECTDKEGLNAYASFKDVLLELNVNAASQADVSGKKELKNKLKSFIAETGPKWVGFIPIIGSIAAAGIETVQSAQRHFGKEAEKTAQSEQEITEIVENELRRLAEKQPLIVFLDDLQWSDNASLNLLYKLSLSIRRKPFPVLLIGSYRPNDIKAGRNKISETGENITVRHPLVDKINELRNYTKQETHIERTDQWLYELAVPALAKNEVELLIEKRFPGNAFPKSFVAKLNELTNGHALFLNEILESMRSKGHIFEQGNQWQINETEISELPVSVNGVIAERVERLDKELRKVLDYAGVYGQDFNIQVIEQVLKIDELDLLDYIQELSEKHGLVVSGDAQPLRNMIVDLYKFTHALVRKYVYEHQESARRRALHKRIAKVIEDLYGENLEADPEAKNLYEQHKRIGSGVIDGVDYTFSKQTVKQESNNSILDFAKEELKAARKAYEEFATEECTQRIDRSLAFINQINADNAESLNIRYDALFLRAENQFRTGYYKNSLDTCEILLPLAEKLQNVQKKAAALKQKAKALTLLAQYQQAIKELQMALSIFTTLQNQDKETADTYNEIGNALSSMGNYDEAKVEFEKALTINRKIGAVDKIAETLINLGSAFRFQGDYNNAQPYYNQALPLAQALNDKPLIARIYNNIGLTINGSGHFADARQYFEKALEIDKELNDRVNLSNHINNIGLSFDNQGIYDKAIEYYLQSLEIDESLDDQVKMAISYNNIGTVYAAKADYEKSLEFHNKALDINLKNNDIVALANTYTHLGNLFFVQNKLEQALEYMQQSMKLSEQMDDDTSLATDFNNIGNVYFSEGKYDEAFDYFNKSLKIHQQLDNKPSIAATYNNMGNVMYMKDDSKQALHYYNLSSEISLELNDLLSLSRSYGNSAMVYAEIEDYENAKRLLEHSVEYDRQLNDEVNLVQHLYKYAKLIYNHFEAADSVTLFDEAIQLYKKIGHNDQDMQSAISYKAFALDYTGEYEQAEQVYREAYDVAVAKDMKSDAAFAAADLAGFYERNLNFEAAKPWLKKMEEYLLKEQNYAKIAEIYSKSAMNHFNNEQYQQAIDILEDKALHYYLQANDGEGMATTLNRIGNSHLQLNNLRKAKKSYQQALDYFNNKDYYWVAILNFNLALVENGQQNFKQAIFHLNEAISYYTIEEAFEDVAETTLWKARIYARLGETDNVVKMTNETAKLIEEHQLDSERLHEMLMDFNQQDRQNNTPHADNDEFPDEDLKP